MTSLNRSSGLLYRANQIKSPQLSRMFVSSGNLLRTHNHRRWPKCIHLRHKANVLSFTSLVILILVFETLSISSASCQIHSAFSTPKSQNFEDRGTKSSGLLSEKDHWTQNSITNRRKPEIIKKTITTPPSLAITPLITKDVTDAEQRSFNNTPVFSIIPNHSSPTSISTSSYSPSSPLLFTNKNSTNFRSLQKSKSQAFQKNDSKSKRRKRKANIIERKYHQTPTFVATIPSKTISSAAASSSLPSQLSKRSPSFSPLSSDSSSKRDYSSHSVKQYSSSDHSISVDRAQAPYESSYTNYCDHCPQMEAFSSANTSSHSFPSASPQTSTILQAHSSSGASSNVPKNVTSQVGHPAYLHCVVESIGDKMVSWIRLKDFHLLTIGSLTYIQDDRFIVRPTTHPVNDWPLQIKHVTLKDEGLYECQINSDPPRSQYYYLHVVVPVSEIVGNPNIFVRSSSPINLTCIISNSPEPPAFVFWYHNNRMINYDYTTQQGSGQISVQKDPNRADVVISRLLIKNARVDDNGNFTCSPSNAEPASVYVQVVQGEKRMSNEQIQNDWNNDDQVNNEGHHSGATRPEFLLPLILLTLKNILFLAMNW